MSALFSHTKEDQDTYFNGYLKFEQIYVLPIATMESQRVPRLQERSKGYYIIIIIL